MLCTDKNHVHIEMKETSTIFSHHSMVYNTFFGTKPH